MELSISKESKDFKQVDKAYELSALLYADSFFYGLFDYGFKLSKADKISISNDLKTSIISSSKGSIRKAKLGILNSSFVLIPKADFRHEDINQYLTMSIGNINLEKEIVRSDYIVNHSIRVCYSVSKKDITLINSCFEAPSLQHYITTIIASIPDGKDGLFVHIIESNIVIVAILEGKIKLANIYEAADVETIFYYISLAYQESDLSTMNAIIHITGDKSQDDQFNELIHSYCSNVTTTSPPISMDNILLEDAYRYTALFNISKCG